MPIQLVAIDMYGTLVGPGGCGIMPHENREALKTALDRGVKIALVTGLNRASALHVLKESKLPLWNGLMIACYNGAVMFEPSTGTVFWELSHPPELGVQVVNHPAIAPHFPMVHGPFDSNDLMWIQQGDHSELVAKYLKQRKQNLGEESVKIVDNLANSITFPSQDICILAPEDDIHTAADQIDHQFRNRVKTEKSLWRDGYAWLEILAPGAGKGKAVTKMCELYGLSSDQVIAIGDNWNDMEMFRQVGLSVAMGNAPDDIKQQTTHVTLSWEQAGVAHAFRKWILYN